MTQGFIKWNLEIEQKKYFHVHNYTFSFYLSTLPGMPKLFFHTDLLVNILDGTQ